MLGLSIDILIPDQNSIFFFKNSLLIQKEISEAH